MHENDYEMIRKKIIARAWKDPKFKALLLKKPREALKEYGLDNIPENIQIECVEDTPKKVTFVLPRPPVDMGELTEAQLEKISGGVGGGVTKGGYSVDPGCNWC